MFNPSKEQRKQLKQDQIKILSGAVCVIALLIWGTWSIAQSYYIPQKLQRVEQIVELQRLIGQHSQLENDLQLAQDSFASLESRAKAKLRLIQRSADEAGFMTSIGQMAEKHGLEMQRFQPGSYAEYAQTQCLNITLHLEGTSQNLYSFLINLHQHSRLLRVEATDISRLSDGACKLTVSLKLFFQPGATSTQLIAQKGQENG